VLGVGNGDPSSHEADRFIPSTFSRPVPGWRWAPLESQPATPARTAELDKGPFKEFDASADATQIKQPGASAVYWTRLHVDRPDLRAGSLALSLGRLDDHGRLFVNGAPAGESNDWRSSPRFDLTGRLHAGDNDIVVVVKNDDGIGGLGRGAFLAGRTEAPPPHRRLFNGLAQVLIAPGAGETTLRVQAEGCQPATLVLKPAKGQ
jgi:beta-galactosidase